MFNNVYKNKVLQIKIKKIRIIKNNKICTELLTFYT